MMQREEGLTLVEGGEQGQGPGLEPLEHLARQIESLFSIHQHDLPPSPQGLQHPG